MKSWFKTLDNRQHESVTLWEEKKHGKPCNCPSLLPGGSCQAVAHGKATKTEFGTLTELRKRSAWEEWGRVLKRSELHKERTPRSTERSPPVFGYIVICTCMRWNSSRPKKEPSESNWLNNLQNLQFVFSPARVEKTLGRVQKSHTLVVE